MARKWLSDKDIARIAEVEAGACPPGVAADEFGVSVKTLRRWRDREEVKERIRLYLVTPKSDSEPGPDESTDSKELLAQLLRRNEELRATREKLRAARELIASQALEIAELRSRLAYLSPDSR